MATLLSTISLIAAAQLSAPPRFQTLMFFGFITSVLTLLFFLHQRRYRRAVLALAICLAALSVYAFLQGAWPVGIVEVVWSAATFARWRRSAKTGRYLHLGTPLANAFSPWTPRHRMSRLFDSN